jgi:hypothetical protein
MIPVNVLVRSVVDQIKISSDISWAEFCLTIANQMEIAEAKLEIAWKLSTDGKDPPRRLDAPAHLLQLIETASKHLSGEIKTQSTKPFCQRSSLPDAADVRMKTRRERAEVMGDSRAASSSQRLY